VLQQGCSIRLYKSLSQACIHGPASLAIWYGIACGWISLQIIQCFIHHCGRCSGEVRRAEMILLLQDLTTCGVSPAVHMRCALYEPCKLLVRRKAAPGLRLSDSRPTLSRDTTYASSAAVFCPGHTAYTRHVSLCFAQTRPCRPQLDSHPRSPRHPPYRRRVTTL